MKATLFTFLLLIVSSSSLLAQFEYVSPKPGSKYHNPGCSIILREGRLLNPSSVADKKFYSVTGSQTGKHVINVRLSDDDKTICLLPVKPFAEAETIFVNVHQGILAKSGATLPALSFNFFIRPQRSPAAQKTFDDYRLNILETEFGESTNTEQKNPSLGGPPFTIGVNTNPAPGDLFYHNISLLGYNVEQVQILTSDGHFVLRYPSTFQGLNFDINKNGYLTAYNELTDSYNVFDSSFNPIDNYTVGNGYITDIHDFVLTPDGHALLIGLDYQTIDMTVYDPDYSDHATVIGAIVQELDADKNVIFEWRSWDDVEVTEALHEALFFSFIDYVHANSIEPDTDGNLLLSCRNLDQVIKINRATGEIMWRLGGIKNEFTFLNDTLRFNYQHDVRRIANGNITLFDNGNYHPIKVSFAKEYRIDEVEKTVSKVWSYSHPFVNGKTVRGFAMGNVQRLPDSHTLINWGSIYAGSFLGKGSPNLTEVDSLGNIVWEMTLNESRKEVIYRAHRYEWAPCARPTDKTLKATNITQSSVKLVWGGATNATGYSVYFKAAADTTWNTKNASGNSRVLNDLLPGTWYEWYVQSKCDDNPTTLSANTNVKKFSTLPQKAVAQFAVKNGKQVFPNPATAELWVQGLTESNYRCYLVDSRGRQIPLKACLVNGSIRVDVASVQPGFYLLNVVSAEDFFTRKIEITAY